MRPVLFVDFYKTISFGLLWHRASKPLHRKIEGLVFGDSVRANSWMRGEISSEAMNMFIAKELAIDYEELWNIFVESSTTIGVSTEALLHIERLKDTYTTVLITDNMDSLSRFTAPAYKLTSVFDRIINSAEVGMLKEDYDGAIFKLVTDDFSDSILVDDNIRVCSLFESLGGRAFRVGSENETIEYLGSLINGASK
jgi:FMN phosphatase YigB (HAD superfamily)